MVSAKQMFFQHSMERIYVVVCTLYMLCALLQNLKFISPCHTSLCQ